MRRRAALVSLLLAASAAAGAASRTADDYGEAPRRSEVVTTRPLEETAPIEVKSKSDASREREYCMRLFVEPEFVRSCIRNRTWKR